MDNSAQQALESGLSEMGLSDHIYNINQYISLLQRWNKAFNLIADVDELTLLNRHIFDCLAARSFTQQGPCLDVGSGAGLPGLLLAVTMPATEWVLLDSNGKKTRFCEQVVQELGLSNVQVVQQRIAHYEPEQCFTSIISRAYSQAADFVTSVKHLLCPEGQVLAMKGRVDKEEKTNAQAIGLHLEIVPMHAPGQSGQRHMMVFSKI